LRGVRPALHRRRRRRHEHEHRVRDADLDRRRRAPDHAGGGRAADVDDLVEAALDAEVLGQRERGKERRLLQAADHEPVDLALLDARVGEGLGRERGAGLHAEHRAIPFALGSPFGVADQGGGAFAHLDLSDRSIGSRTVGPFAR
jgi:hypothetical protein